MKVDPDLQGVHQGVHRERWTITDHSRRSRRSAATFYGDRIAANADRIVEQPEQWRES
jgi:hypothetical protein